MSAWIVSKRHIDALVTAAGICGQPTPDGLPPLEQATDLGRALWLENAKSVRYRYDDADESGMVPDLEAYAFSPLRVSLVRLAKAARCYAYQSCEHPEWKTSPAYRLTTTLFEGACLKLGMSPEDVQRSRAYDAAEWGID